MWKYKKLLVFVFLIIFPFLACGVAQDYAIINQYNPTFKASEYSYRGHNFWENGCGPASVANAIIAGLEVTDEETAAKILLDVLQAMTGNPQKNSVDVKRYSYLVKALQWLYEEKGYTAVSYDYIITANDFFALVPQAPIVIFSKADNNNRWETALQYAAALEGTNAKIYMVRVGTGTAAVGGPLAAGVAGHFVTIEIPVEEFLNLGAFYLLDSAPSALADEKYGSKEYYRVRYPFAANPIGHKKFLDTYGIKRIAPEIIKFYLLKQDTNATKLFTLYGSFFWMIIIP